MILYISLGVFVLIAVICLFAWYRIVDPSEAHLVATPTGKFVASPDEKVGSKRTYFAIPSWVPFFGRAIRIMDVTIKELPLEHQTIEKGNARYNVKSSTKYKVSEVKTAAERFITNDELKEQLKEIIKAGVRATTVKYDVITARASKKEMENKIREEITDDLNAYGLELINFQLVEFSDTAESKIISNISRRREVEIEATTREQNAEKEKQAKIKEADAMEKSRTREIAKDKVIEEQEEEKKKFIAIKKQKAEEERFKVVQIQVIKQAEIDKQKAIIKANEEKETEEINKEKKKLEGEGDRQKAEEIAKGEAAPIREKGIAEAEAKEKLQKALNKFGDEAIRALVAEKVVAMQETVGVETAKALANADVKLFSGGGATGKQGFDLGAMISSMSVSNENTAQAVLNKLARPNDLGLTTLGLKSLADTPTKTKTTTSTEKTKNKDNNPTVGDIVEDIKKVNVGKLKEDLKKVKLNK